MTDSYSDELNRVNKLLVNSTYGKHETIVCSRCGQETWPIYQKNWPFYQIEGSNKVLCTFCQASDLELQTMGEGYPETIKVLIDLYSVWLDQWASYNNNLRDGVAILHEANTLGWELDFVRRKWTEDLEEIPGHVIARKM